MFQSAPNAIFPILFAMHQPVQHHHLSHLLTFPNTSFETGIHRIHSPLRILRGISGGGLTLIPNSTTAPVRTSASSVLIAFDVKTIDGNRWNARMISNERSMCEVFLMDSVTLQRKAMLKLSVAPHHTDIGHSISTSLTLFDIGTIVYSGTWLMAMMSCCCSMLNQKCNHMTARNHELELHRTYKLMVTRGIDFKNKDTRQRGWWLCVCYIFHNFN